jgi:hypothetical protein
MQRVFSPKVVLPCGIVPEWIALVAALARIARMRALFFAFPISKERPT